MKKLTLKRTFATLSTLLLILSSLSLGAKDIATAAKTPLQISIENEYKVLPANSDTVANIRITVKALPQESKTIKVRPQLNLAIVIDRSGSMSAENRLLNAKKAAIRALDSLQEGDVFSLVTFDGTVKVNQEAVIYSPAAKSEIISIINQLQPGGTTALFSGVSHGAEQLRKNINKNYVNRILLLSDGDANVGERSVEGLRALGLSLLKENISVSTIGVGIGYNENLMTALAQGSDGNFYYVANSDDLSHIFKNELEGSVAIAAKTVRMRIQCPEGVTPLGFIGFDMPVNNNGMDVKFNQIYDGQEKTFIMQVKLPPGKDKSEMNVLSLTLDGENLDGISFAQLNSDTKVKFSSDSKVQAASINIDAATDVKRLVSAKLRQDAIVAADKLDFKAAEYNMTLAKEELDKAEAFAPAARRSEIAREKEIVSVQTSGLKDAAKSGSSASYSRARKAIVGDNYQRFNNQVYNQANNSVESK